MSDKTENQQGTEPQTPEKGSDYIVEKREYVDAAGRHVTERIVVQGSLLEGMARFTGHALVDVNTPQGVAKMECDFPIRGATDPVSAYEKLASALEAAKPQIAERINKERREALKRQQRVVVSNGVPPEPRGQLRRLR